MSLGANSPVIQIGGWLSVGVDGDGVTWRITDLTGLDDPPPSKSNFTDRPFADGTFDSGVFDDARIITFAGQLIAPSRGAREAAKLTIGQLSRTLKDPTTVTFTTDGGVYTVTARRSGAWTVDPLGPLGLRYQAMLVCPDPNKYGPLMSASTGLPAAGATGLAFPLFATTGRLEFGTPGNPGQVTLLNPGTTEAALTFTITGPVLGGIVLTDTASGRQIVYADDVADGATLLIIDSATGRATLNGADRSGELTVKQWWTAPADGWSTVQFATLGVSGQTGTLTASLRPAYE